MSRKAEIIVLINNLTQGRDLKVFGEQRVNVLELNIALDGLTPARLATRSVAGRPNPSPKGEGEKK